MHYQHVPTMGRFLSHAHSRYHHTRRSISQAPSSLAARLTRCWQCCLKSKRTIHPCRLFRTTSLFDDGMDYDLDYSHRDSLGSYGAARDQVPTRFEAETRSLPRRSCVPFSSGDDVPLLSGEDEGEGDGGGLGPPDVGDDSHRLGPDYSVFYRIEAMKAAYASQCYRGVMGKEIVP